MKWVKERNVGDFLWIAIQSPEMWQKIVARFLWWVIFILHLLEWLLFFPPICSTKLWLSDWILIWFLIYYLAGCLFKRTVMRKIYFVYVLNEWPLISHWLLIFYRPWILLPMKSTNYFLMIKYKCVVDAHAHMCYEISVCIRYLWTKNGFGTSFLKWFIKMSEYCG